ncbi:hypothetical protein Syn7502_02121 [Synechococcus sp. PCC 7502]|uniref:hypothetical protein n=1 Tax=Synechococcus sp. PCC 7502 TaxID=1173263 RepID=UPI00029FE17A|nr:hypothetical protein [Synechococcus sp. PCC 7502]AFY74136.1 hypothetical protein Syn7502_02121 [Synechococcus sp. PCC 7502]
MLSKFKLSALIGIACCIIGLCTAFIGFSQSSEPSIQLTTNPAIAQIIPLEAEATKYLGSGKYESPVQLKFQAKSATGSTLENARFHLQILTPAPTPWLTTDFPIVEGTKLLDISGDAPTGEFLIDQVFPIRGQYQLQVDVTSLGTNGFAPISQSLSLTVPENPLKFKYFPFVLLVLLAIGFGGGWVIGGRQQIRDGEIAPRPVRLMLSGVTILAIAALLFFNVSAELGKAHAEISIENSIKNSGLIQSQGLKLELNGDDHTAVGQMASFQLKLTDSQTNQPISDALFAVKSTQIENNWVSFAYQGVPDHKGLLTWQEQFFDGAPHKVEVEVSPRLGSDLQFEPFQVSREIEVEGIAPPMSVRFIGLFYFTIVLALGLIAGLWFQNRRLRNKVRYNKVNF